MNCVVILTVAVACLAQSSLAGYASVYPAAYGHGALLAGGAYGAGVGSGGAYHGPLARPVVLPSGYLADTPEVAAAKGAHLNALTKTSSIAAATGVGAYTDGAGAGSGVGAYYDRSDDHLWAADGSYRRAGTVGAYGAGAYGAGIYAAGAYGAGVYGAGAYGAGAGAGYRYAGPLAAPVVLPSGYLADTHDVAAAKGAHLTAVANAATRASSASYAGAYGAYGHGYHH